MHTIVRVARSRLAYQNVICSRVSKLSSQSAESETTEKVVPEGDAEDPLALKDVEIAALQAKLATEKDLLADLKNKYLRALADGENVRNRAKKELENSKIFSIQSFAKDMLPVSDVLEKALESVPESERSNKVLANLYEGVSLTHSQLHQVFKRHNLVKITPLGEEFDPVYHEAMFQVPDPTQTPGTVMNVIQSGYVLHSRSIRSAKVGVVKET